ncbi:MAG: hypothetical protein WA989_12145 [Henriciella sp.]|uniref:hypothetical protein n=1 Tax=Henriciella sp. TaxID=1968823 RepID=UPI003C78D12A
MKRRYPMRLGLASLGLAGLSACQPAMRGPDTEAMGHCYRAIQKAMIAINADGVALAPGEIELAADTLQSAEQDLILAWAQHEGVGLKRDDIIYRTPAASDFIEGIEAEVALSRQAVENEMVEADANPALWSAKLDDANECAGQLAS